MQVSMEEIANKLTYTVNNYNKQRTKYADAKWVRQNKRTPKNVAVEWRTKPSKYIETSNVYNGVRFK